MIQHLKKDDWMKMVEDGSLVGKFFEQWRNSRGLRFIIEEAKIERVKGKECLTLTASQSFELVEEEGTLWKPVGKVNWSNDLAKFNTVEEHHRILVSIDDYGNMTIR